jgi:hypothetical protein
MLKKVLKQYLAGLFSGLLTRATRQVSCLITINYENINIYSIYFVLKEFAEEDNK